MKKFTAIALSAALIASLAACSKPAAPAATTAAAAPAATTAAQAAAPAATTAAPAATEAAKKADPITLVLGHTNAESDTRQTMVLKFKDIVEEKTNGEILIDIYAGGTLGGSREEIEGLKMGTQDILVEGYNIISFYSDMCNDTMPYMYRDYDHFMKCWYDSKVGEMWTKYAADAGFTVFGPSYRGYRVVTSMKPFHNADEVAGLKIRVPGGDVWAKTWQTLGAQPTPMDLSEVITALQQGTVEAQENPVLLSYNNGFADVVKYLIRTNHVCGADVFIMDSDRFAQLTAEQQQILKDAAVEAAKEISKVNLDSEEDYIKKFQEKGVEIIEPDMDSFMSKFTTFAEDNFPNQAEVVKAIAEVK